MRRHPELRRLEALVGEWELTALVGGDAVAGGRTSFRWIEDGAFLLQRTEADVPSDAPPGWLANAPFPTTAVIGLDQRSGTFSHLYADARGVARVYGMRLDGDRWEIWGRPADDFHQRFAGTFAPGGDAIAARWERSADGSSWELDFELTYKRVA